MANTTSTFAMQCQHCGTVVKYKGVWERHNNKDCPALFPKQPRHKPRKKKPSDTKQPDAVVVRYRDYVEQLKVQRNVS